MQKKMVFVGTAGHVRYVLADLAAHRQVRFSAYAPSFPGEEVASLGRVDSGDGPASRYDDWRAMLDAERPDIVVVCGRYDLNAPIALEAVRRGCHVISEKPAATTLADLAALREAVAKAGVLYTSMLGMRYALPFYTARTLVAEGLIGEVYLINGQKSYRWGNNRPEWYADPVAYGSTMGWVGIHAFDYCRWIAGVEFAEVCGYHANLVHTERPGCQDVATVAARLTNGGCASFTMDYLRPEAASTHGDDRARIVGSRGILEVRDEGRRLEVITADREVAEWPLPEHGRTFFGDFVAALEGRGELLITAEEAFRVTEFALKAALSADEGRPVRM
jgi:predicted dehydrogenase